MDNYELLIVLKDVFEKSMDKMEKKFDEKIEEVKIHTGALIEQLGSQVKAVAEGDDILLRKIDETKVDLIHSINNLEKRIDNIDKNMAIVKDCVIGVI